MLLEPARGESESGSLDPDDPVYEVTVWTRLREPEEIPEERRGFFADSWRISGADAGDVLAWAEERAAGSPFAVHVLAPPDEDHVTRIRLGGTDPTIHRFTDEATYSEYAE